MSVTCRCPSMQIRVDTPQCMGEEFFNSNSNLSAARLFQFSSWSQKGENAIFSQHRLVILSLADFKLVTLCTMSSIVPLIIPPAFHVTHLPSLCSLMPGPSFLCTCSRKSINQHKQKKVRTEVNVFTVFQHLSSQTVHLRKTEGSRSEEKKNIPNTTTTSWSTKTADSDQ